MRNVGLTVTLLTVVRLSSLSVLTLRKSSIITGQKLTIFTIGSNIGSSHALIPGVPCSGFRTPREQAWGSIAKALQIGIYMDLDNDKSFSSD